MFGKILFFRLSLVIIIFYHFVTFASDKWSLWNGETNLRGANIYQRKVYPELDGPTFLGPGYVGPPYTQQDFNRLAAMGANYVNISHPGLFTEKPPYLLDEDIQTNLDNLLQMIEQADMFAVISFRTGPGRSEFTFFWGEDGDWFDAGYYNDQVWVEQEAQDAWVEMWRYTAARYRNNPVVVGYDLMVEPNSNEVWLDLWDQNEFYQNYGGTLYDWNQLFPRITQAIRTVDQATPILVGGMGYSAMDWLPYIQPSGDLRTVYTVHQYAPYVYTHQEPPLNKTYPGYFDANWDGVPDQVNQAWLTNLYSTIDDFKAAYQVPVAINEFGLMRWEPGAAEFMNDQMNLMEQRGMNYAIWLWETSWEEYEQEVDAFNFRHGPDPNHHSDVVSSDLINTIVNHWQMNTIRPSNFSGKTYYVSTQGNDSNDGLTPQTAWRTLQFAAEQVTPGDSVKILAGTYQGFTLQRSGLSGAYITFCGVSKDDVIVQDGIEFGKSVSFVKLTDLTVQGYAVWGIFIRGMNRYIYLTNLKVCGGECGIHLTWGYSALDPIDGSVSNIFIENCQVMNTVYTAIDGTPGPCDSLLFKNLEISGAGVSVESFWGADGIAIERGNFITVEDCYVHDNGGDGIDLCSRDSNGGAQGIVVQGNTVIRNRSNGIKLWAGGKIVNNFVGGTGNTPLEIGAFAGDYELINNTIAYNMQDPSYSVRNYSFVAAWPDDNTGISAQINLTLLNNIFAFNCNNQMGGPTGIFLGEGVTLVEEGYNCFFSRSDGEIQAEFVQGETWFTRDDIINGTWAAATGQGDGDITLNPQFADSSSFDFRLMQGSPCIDAGNPATQYNDVDGTRNDMGGYGGPGGESYEYPGPTNKFQIAGTVSYHNSENSVGSVHLVLASTDTFEINTDESGRFQFQNIAGGRDYILTPSKTGDISASTVLGYDAFLTAQIAIGIFDDPTAYQLLAADADGNGLIQMYDASMIARYAVDLPPLPGTHVGSWLFVPNSYTFTQLNSNIDNADFTAIVTGDVDGNWSSSVRVRSLREEANGQIPFTVDIVDQQTGRKAKIHLLSEKDETICSCDLVLKYNSQKFQFNRIEKTFLSRDFEFYSNDQEKGILKITGFATHPIKKSGTYLTIIFDMPDEESDTEDIECISYRINADPPRQGVISIVVDNKQSVNMRTFSLDQNYPNPFNSSTLIRYKIFEDCHVRLEILDVLGKSVRKLVNGLQAEGEYGIIWDGRDQSGTLLPSGIYFYKIKAGEFQSVKKMTLMK